MGDPDARLILQHLVRNINFENLPCEIVAKRLIAIIDDIAETVYSVGDREKFGFDITAFKNSGQIHNRKRYSDPGERLKISFESSDNEIFPNFKNNGVDNNE
ncbi:MAG: hypothetical protein OXC46_11585 [Thaumarchaeota archaeon]|nr:hypothetical protein [Nitrososphaerota archaeon]